MGGYLVYCVFVRLRISQRRKKVAAWNFACLLDYYPDISSPILVVTGQTSKVKVTRDNGMNDMRVHREDMFRPLLWRVCMWRSRSQGQKRENCCVIPIDNAL